ncbi:MAG: MerR family transcriptional regulator [Dehalococcoidia bacterium]|nr:MerR family transcriptional regulator [Dehalococcoidia bacterium]
MTQDRTRNSREQKGWRVGLSEDEPVFQISVVARMVGLHQQTIRSYERIGLVQPARTQGNTRLFSHQDVERLHQVVRLVNDLGVNLAGVEVILRLSRQVEDLQRELAETRHELRRTRAELGRHDETNQGGGNTR